MTGPTGPTGPTDPDWAGLERRYRRLLAWYPPRYRQENGPEILAVLMAGARPGQRRPGLAEAADLIFSGIRTRLRLRRSRRLPGSARRVQAAVRLLHAGAAASAVGLTAGVALLALAPQVAVPQVADGRPFPGRSLATGRPLLVLASTAFGLVVVLLWLWMARAVGRRRNWTRALSTALFVLATSQLGVTVSAPPGDPAPGVTFLYYAGIVPFLVAWLVGATVVCLLWLPAAAAASATDRSTPR